MASAISSAQRREFAARGFLVLPGAVDAGLVDDALRAVNAWIDASHDARHADSYRARTYAPELTSDPVITRLLTASGALHSVEELVGRRLAGGGGAQIALRFPTRPAPQPSAPAAPHIDGIAVPGNGLPPGRLHGFTALTGVMLSDVSQPGAGNLTVWPGTHHAVAEVLRRTGSVVDDGPAFLAELVELAGRESEPVAVLGEPGDVVVAHYLLLHTVGPHTSPHVRYAVYFRLRAEGREELGDEVYADPWAEWPAMRGGPGSAGVK